MISTKLIFASILMTWSAAGGALVVNNIHHDRGVVVIERVRYAPNPFASEVEKYAPLMEQLLGDRMASAPVGVRVSSPEHSRVSVPVPRPRPERITSRGHGRTIEDMIVLAEAGL